MSSFYANSSAATLSFAARPAFATAPHDAPAAHTTVWTRAQTLRHTLWRLLVAGMKPTRSSSFANREGHADGLAQQPGSGQRPGDDRLGKPIRILLVDDHSLVRQNLRLVIDHQSDFEVVGEATNGHEAVGLAERLRPDVVLMDISMPKINGIQATRLITHAVPATRIIALSMHDDPGMTQSMLDAGAAAYLVKGGPPQELIATILRVHNAR